MRPTCVPVMPGHARVLNMKIIIQAQLQSRPLKDSGLPKEIHMSKRSLRACSKQRLRASGQLVALIVFIDIRVAPSK